MSNYVLFCSGGGNWEDRFTTFSDKDAFGVEKVQKDVIFPQLANLEFDLWVIFYYCSRFKELYYNCISYK